MLCTAFAVLLKPAGQVHCEPASLGLADSREPPCHPAQAFDVYDTEEAAFYSVTRRNAFLANTTISIVPTVASGAFCSADDLRPLLDTPSAYRDGAEPVEGIVVRIDDDAGSVVTPAPHSAAAASPAVPSKTPGTAKGHLLRRGKFVRADFVQGIADAGHWSKGALVKNVIVR